MPYVYAGLWGPDAFTDSYGNTLVGATLTVYRAGTLTAATLYTDQSKATVSLNPVSPDPYGNFKFWADPGLYDLNLNYQGQVAQTIPAVLVSVNPLEAAGVTVPDGSITGGPAAIGVKLAQTTITHDNVATANKDGLVGVPSLRTIGTGALQAAAGNDSRIVSTFAAVPAPLTGATGATRFVGGTTAGAPTSGTWAIGDFVIDQKGDVWVCTTAGTPGTWTQVGGKPWMFFPEAYGAKGDGATDDTAAIKSAVNAAVTYAQANNNYAEVVFGSKTYLVNGALTQGGATKGNAIIPLPMVATTAIKVTLVFRGTRDASALAHWQQTTPQANGTVIKTTLTNGTNDVTFGEASVIGGPTPTQNYGPPTNAFNNMLIVIDGVTIFVPWDTSYCGFDFRGMAEADVVTASVMAQSTPAGTMSNPAAMTRQWTFGLAMPLSNNNANSNVGWYSCEGICYGFMPSEHTYAASVRCIYCIIGIEFASGGGVNMPHRALIGYACVESCSQAIGFLDGTIYCDILQLDVESVTNHIFDPSNRGVGTINVHDASHTAPAVNGGSLLRIVDGTRKPGNVAAPAVPASTVALKNPFYRDAAVNITGGTVSAIAIDGVATGFTATGVTVVIPPNRTITLTYTVAPSWIWTLL